MSPVRPSGLLVRIGARFPLAGARQLGSWLSIKAKAFAFCLLACIITHFGPERKTAGDGCHGPWPSSRWPSAPSSAPDPRLEGGFQVPDRFLPGLQQSLGRNSAPIFENGVAKSLASLACTPGLNGVMFDLPRIQS